MKIDLENIAKEVFKEKPLVIKKIDKNLIKVFYKGKSPRNTPKPIILPKIINLDEEIIENVGMYIGDGTLSPTRKHQIEFTTIDVDMAKKFLDFLTKRWCVKIQNITFILKYNKGNKKTIKEKWKKYLNVPSEKLLVKKETKYNARDSLTIIVNSLIFTQVFKKFIKKSLPLIKLNSKLIKAFLRGEFAADGKFIVEKDTNTYYISEITFCYNYPKELWLRNYLVECLKKEGITKINENRKGFIRITGWNNYFKLWKMGIFNCCKRKKEKFLSTIKQSKIHLMVDVETIKQIINSSGLTKKAIANKVGINRSNLFRVLNGKQLMTIEQFNALTQLIDNHLNTYQNQISKIRIGKLTYLPFSREFINFVAKEKLIKGDR